MANPYPADFDTDEGAVRLAGEIVFTDPANQPGGAPVVQTRAIYTSSGTNINNAASALLPFTTQVVGSDPLLDISAPTQPTIVTAGVYAFSGVVSSQASLTAGGNLFIALRLNPAGMNPTALEIDLLGYPAAAAGGAFVPLAATYVLPAGAVVEIEVTNLDGVQAQAIDLKLAVQRLS